MNPSKFSIITSVVICGLLTALLTINEANRPKNPENDLAMAEKKALIIADQIDQNLTMLRASIESLSFNNYWQTSPVGEWGFWLNSQTSLYQAAGISLLGVHSLSNDVLYFEKPSRPGKFEKDIEQPIKRLYKSESEVNLLQLFRGSPAIINLTPIKDVENKIIGALVAIKHLDTKVLKHYHHLAQVPVVVINNNQIKAKSIENSIDLKSLKLVNVIWPNEIKSSLWTLSLLVKPSTALYSSLTYMIVGIILTLILIIILLKQFNATKVTIKQLNNDLDINLPIAEQIVRLTKLQNNISESEHSELIQSIRLRLEQLVQQKKTLSIEVRKLKENTQELRLAATSLSNERDNAIAAPRLKSEFLSRMGDEITTPMKSVISMLKLLSEYQLDPEAKQILNIAKRSTRTLVDNLNNILDFSKLDAGMLKLTPRKFMIRELVDDLSAELSHYANEKDISLQASCAPELASEVIADKNRIRQILRNLLGNAIRFTKSGEISLYADSLEENGKHLLRFTVKDSGVGIAKEAQKGLFDSLEQSTKLTNSSFAGRLRLIVSKNLAELMGGEIGVISETGKGSQFWFTVISEE
jgi:signal transduction histidine kinase